MKINLLQNIMIIQLPECYDIITMGEFFNIVKNKDQYNGVEYLIIDGSELKQFSEGIGEIMIVKNELNIKEIIFVNLPELIRIVFKITLNNSDDGDIVEFTNIDDAINYLNKIKLERN